MKKFNKQILDLVKKAAFQDKSVMVLTSTDDELTCAYQGSEDELVESLHKALLNDHDLYRIIKRAVVRKDHKDKLETTIFNLKTA